MRSFDFKRKLIKLDAKEALTYKKVALLRKSEAINSFDPKEATSLSRKYRKNFHSSRFHRFCASRHFKIEIEMADISSFLFFPMDS